MMLKFICWLGKNFLELLEDVGVKKLTILMAHLPIFILTYYDQGMYYIC